MKTKTRKSKKQSDAKWTTIRVHEPMKMAAVAKLKEINSKEYGRKLLLDEVLLFAINRLDQDDVKLLHEMSLSHEDRKELLRQKWIALYGPITEEEFTGETLKPEFSKFLIEHSQGAVAI